MSKNLHKDEVIERFCLLSRDVAEHFSFIHSADCFCGKSGCWGSEGYGPTISEGYRFDSVITDFIKTAVAEKIERERKQNEQKPTEPLLPA